MTSLFFVKKRHWESYIVVHCAKGMARLLFPRLPVVLPVCHVMSCLRLRICRIRVGIDCGLVEWGISSSNQGLTYSGAPVAAAEKLASMAAAGQVLSTYAVMLEMHRLQATLGIPLEAEEAAAASAERGSRTGFGSEAAFRGPAVVSTPLPPPSGRAGLASARQRRQQIFACRYTRWAW